MPKCSATPYKALGAILYTEGLDYPSLGQVLGRSKTYVGERMRGVKPWTMDDAYSIMKAFDLPVERLPEYFPPRALKSDKQRRPHP